MTRSLSFLPFLGSIPLVLRVVPQLPPPPVERETTIMTQGELDRLRESHSFSSKRSNQTTQGGGGLLRVVVWRAHKFSMPLNEFRSLFILYKNPNLDSRWLYFNLVKEDLAQGIPQQRQGMEEEIPLYLGKRLGVLLGDIQGCRSSKDKHCNKPLVLSTTEQERLDGILDSVLGENFFTIKEVLKSKFFRRYFKLNSKSMASSGGDNGKDIQIGGMALVVGDKGESHHSRDESYRDDHSQDGSIEYIGTIRKEMRKVLPRLPDLTLLGILGEKSDHSSLVWNQVALAQALSQRPDQIHGCRPSLDQMGIQECKPGDKVDPGCEGGTYWRESPRDEVPDISPSKKGKSASNVKKKVSKAAVVEGTSANSGVVFKAQSLYARKSFHGKKTLRGSDPTCRQGREKNESSVKAPTKAKALLSKTVSKAAAVEGTSANSGVVFKAQSLYARKSRHGEKSLGGSDPTCRQGRASRYFGEGFDFYKRQISRLQPDLDIQGIGIDVDILKEEEKEEEEKEIEKEGEKEEENEEGEKGETSPLSP
ncbi:hypothetical protein Acr_00g0032370 [Actinidia rufa]|uniref:Uncharacterized protein n=1 Tax=Actinidia rufa TaxID=165716 RepID=A0A7J0DFX2_9ERIC|nr:hypothetical protein Acr_00g0032370 [Actinidia rufa]